MANGPGGPPLVDAGGAQSIATAPFRNAIAAPAVGTGFTTAPDAFMTSCTVAGNMVVLLLEGGQCLLELAAGDTRIWPLQVVEIVSATATFTAFILLR